MYEIKVTSKGQVTIPKAVRDQLNLKRGDRVVLEKAEDGAWKIVRLDSPSKLFGMVNSPARRPATLAEMQRSIEKGAHTGEGS